MEVGTGLRMRKDHMPLLLPLSLLPHTYLRLHDGIVSAISIQFVIHFEPHDQSVFVRHISEGARKAYTVRMRVANKQHVDWHGLV